MKQTIYFLFFILMFSACSKNDISGDYIETLIGINYIDKEGNDLLNPEAENAINTENIDIYYLKDGEKVRVCDYLMEIPENYYVNYSETHDKYYLVVFMSEYMNEENISETYIDFGEWEDTIRCQYHVVDSGNFWYERVWYNGEKKIHEDNYCYQSSFEIIIQ